MPRKLPAMKFEPKTLTSDPSLCPFCNMGQHKRKQIYYLTRNMSRKDLIDLSKKLKSERDAEISSKDEDDSIQ